MSHGMSACVAPSVSVIMPELHNERHFNCLFKHQNKKKHASVIRPIAIGIELFLFV